MFVGELPDHRGRGEQPVQCGGLLVTSGVGDQRVPLRGEAGPVGLQDLGRRRSLVSPAVTGLLRRGQVESRLRAGDRGDQEPQVVLDGPAQLVRGDGLLAAVHRYAVDDRCARIVDPSSQPRLGPRCQICQSGTAHRPRPPALSAYSTGSQTSG
jgi:hypothetical protein